MRRKPTLEAVCSGSSMDVFAESFPDGRSGDGECSITKPHPYMYFIIFIIFVSLSEWCVAVQTVGKLGQLSAIITDLETAHQRAVVLAQSSRMLDLLEAFMDARCVRYLRLSSHHSVRLVLAVIL